MNRPALKLLQTPVQPATTPGQFDASRPAPHTDALRKAWFAGQQQGFKAGYVQGWRWGLACGFSTLLCLAILIMGVAIGLGWQP